MYSFTSLRFGLVFSFAVVAVGTTASTVADEPRPNHAIQIEFDGKFVQGVVSPNGKQLLFNAGKKWTQTSIFLSDLRGRNAQKLIDNQFRNDQPSWRPDGKGIAFRSNETGTPQIYTVDIDGRNKQQLTKVEHGVSNPRYSSKGFLSYLSKHPKVTKVADSDLVIRRNGQETKIVRKLCILETAWSNNGSLIAVSMPSNLLILRADGTEVGRLNLREKDERFHSHRPTAITWSSGDDEIAFHIPFFGGRIGEGSIFGDEQICNFGLEGDFKIYKVGQLSQNAPQHVKVVEGKVLSSREHSLRRKQRLERSILERLNRKG